MRICHVTSAHPSSDVRILVKECSSLANAGYEVFLVAKGDSRESLGVRIVGAGACPSSRLKRMFSFARKVFKLSLKLDCDIYHLHDPELINFVKKYKKAGKTVIFDCHEDVGAQIEDKEWIPGPFRKMVANSYKRKECRMMKRVDAIVAATPHIATLFEGKVKNLATVNNFPKLDEYVFQDTPFKNRERIICYTGLINAARGEKQMVDTMQYVDGELILAGLTESEPATSEKVKYLGNLPRSEVNNIYKKSRVGLVVFQPKKNHIDSQPNKIFEYMASGLPIVGSNFPLWKELIEDNQCGLCVDPNNPEEIGKACSYYLDHDNEAEEAGKNGRKAVEALYNWKNEEKKLLDLYKVLINGKETK